MIKHMINKDNLYSYKYNLHKQISTEQKLKLHFETNFKQSLDFHSPKYIFDFFDSSKESCSIIKQENESENKKETVHSLNQDSYHIQNEELNSTMIKDFLKDDSMIDKKIETCPLQSKKPIINNIITSNDSLKRSQWNKPQIINTQTVMKPFQKSVKSKTNQSSPRDFHNNIKLITNDYKDIRSPRNIAKTIEYPFNTKICIKKRNEKNKNRGTVYNFQSANISKENIKKTIFDEILSTVTQIEKKQNILKPSQSLRIIDRKSGANKIPTNPNYKTKTSSLGKSNNIKSYKKYISKKRQDIYYEFPYPKGLIKKDHINNEKYLILRKDNVIKDFCNDVHNKNDTDKFFNDQLQKKRNKTRSLTTKFKTHSQTKPMTHTNKLRISPKNIHSINDSQRNMALTIRSDRLLSCYFSNWK